MKVVGFFGASGAGKTTLMRGVIVELKRQQQRVSVIKHAHAGFDIDDEGKDTWVHRQAGAFEVLVASGRRLAKMREFETPIDLNLHALIAEMADCDWLLVEGFKHADILKVEVWRAALDARPLYPEDPFVVAIASDEPAALPVETQRPAFRLDDAAALAAYLQRDAARFDYRSEHHG
jgi:molybdopterin-guanine dinucleotide biosynthesis protein B